MAFSYKKNVQMFCENVNSSVIKLGNINSEKQFSWIIVIFYSLEVRPF